MRRKLLTPKFKTLPFKPYKYLLYKHKYPIFEPLKFREWSDHTLGGRRGADEPMANDFRPGEFPKRRMPDLILKDPDFSVPSSQPGIMRVSALYPMKAMGSQ
jgi:hypothetical protein